MALLMNIQGIIIELKSLACPSCKQIFAAPMIEHMPPMDVMTPMETDLHRILPDGLVRSSMVAICPNCVYAWWTTSFELAGVDPESLAKTPEVEYSKKFAHAVLTGRKIQAHSIDRAILALNGYWCARECGSETMRWLTLAAQEFVTALSDEEWYGNRDRFHYLLAETYRLLGDFKNAIKEYGRVQADNAKLPQQLIDQQKTYAMRKWPDPVALDPSFVRLIFFPEEWEKVCLNEEDLVSVPMNF